MVACFSRVQLPPRMVLLGAKPCRTISLVVHSTCIYFAPFVLEIRIGVCEKYMQRLGEIVVGKLCRAWQDDQLDAVMKHGMSPFRLACIWHIAVQIPCLVTDYDTDTLDTLPIVAEQRILKRLSFKGSLSLSIDFVCCATSFCFRLIPVRVIVLGSSGLSPFSLACPCCWGSYPGSVSQWYEQWHCHSLHPCLVSEFFPCQTNSNKIISSGSSVVSIPFRFNSSFVFSSLWYGPLPHHFV